MAEVMPGKENVVRKTIKVEAPIERAFAVFTEKMGTWWPATHHIAKEPFVAVVIEPRSGGRWFERDAQGSECQWGGVLAWEPPKRVVLSWHLGPDWKYDPDKAKASEVEFLFIAEGPKNTRVELTHSHFERHGEGWQAILAGVDSPGGWTGVLAPYIEAAKL